MLIIALGASAGGLAAFEAFFKAMPKQDLAAIVCVQHLDPQHESLLPGIISQYTDMPVQGIEDGISPGPGTIYMLPQGKLLELKDHKFKLSPIQKKKGRPIVIDYFFRSLKQELGGQAVAVLLSGTGSDGTQGVREIKAAGGMVLVQSPESAPFPELPLSAIKTGMTDFILPPEAMPAKIIPYLEQQKSNEENLNEKDLLDARKTRKILIFLKNETGADFSEYKQTTVKRRLQRRLSLNQIKDLEDYLDFLEEQPAEREALKRDLLINVTSFFRDAEVFYYIKKEIVPQLFKKNTNKIRIWVPACSSGEEAYTWAVLLYQYLDEHQLKQELQIFATDIEAENLEKARKGWFSANIAVDVPDSLLSAYFQVNNNGYQVIKRVRDSIVFAEHNLLKDPVYPRIDLVSCRNLLIYLEKNARQRVLSSFHYALKKDGLLVLGTSEGIDWLGPRFFENMERRLKVYRKQDKADLKVLGRSLHSPHSGFSGQEREEVLPLEELAEQMVLERYTPAGAIINKSNEVLFLQGDTAKYLELKPGKVSYNILNIVKKELRPALGSAINKTEGKHSEVIEQGIKLLFDENHEYTDIRVLPFQHSGEDLRLINFLPSRCKPVENIPASLENQGRVQELERELEQTRSYLMDIVEKLRNANEELTASNEEGQASNEELQSANEELESSREELQSLNEELLTTNHQLKTKIGEVLQANNDIENLLRSSQTATLFLDKNLEISLFTPAVSRFFNIDHSDMGMPFDQKTSKLKYKKLLEDIQQVRENLVPLEKEVESRDGAFLWMKIAPYRTLDDHIEGVVLSFTDISEKKKQEAELQKYQTELEKMVEDKTRELSRSMEFLQRTGETAKVGGWEINLKENLVYWTEMTRKIHEVPSAFVPDLDTAIKFFPGKSREILAKAVDKAIKEGEQYDLELEFLTYKKKKLWVHTIGHPVMRKGKCVRLYGTFQDITQRKEAQHKIVELADERSRILGSISDGFFVLNHQMKVEYYNEAAEKLLGKSSELVIGRHLFDAFPEAKNSIFQEKYSYALEKQEEVSFEAYFQPYDDWYMVKAYPYSGKISVYFQVITEQKRLEQELRQNEERFRKISELSSDYSYCVYIDEDGSLKNEWYFGAFQRITGYNPETVWTDGSLEKLFHPDDFHLLAERDKLIHQGQVAMVEMRIITKNGEVKWIQDKGEPQWNEDKTRICRIIGTARDISKRKQAEIALKRKQDMLARTEEIALIGSWQWDVATDTVEWSDQLFRIFRRNPALGTPTYADHPKLYPPEELARLDKHVKLAVEQGIPYSLELRVDHDDGTSSYCIAMANPEFNEEGKVIGLVGSFQDITRLKETEFALDRSQLRFKELFEIISSGVIIFQVSGKGDKAADYKIKEISYKAEKLLCRERQDDPLGQTLENFDSSFSDTVTFLKQSWQKAEEVDFDLEMEYQGQKIFLDCSAYRLSGNELALVYDDVTLNRKAEIALRESEEKYKFLTESTSELICLLNAKGEFEYLSPSVKSLLGYEVEELLQSNCLDLLPDASTKEAEELIRKLEQRQILFYQFQHQSRRKDGCLLYFDSVIDIIPDQQGKISKIISRSRDITKQKESEERMIKLLNERETLLREINHRVKNNLQIVCSLLTLQARKVDEEKLSRILTECRNRIQSIAIIHRSFYESEDFQHIDMRMYVRQFVIDSYSNFDNKNINLQTKIANITLHIDFAIPCAIILNELVNNSFKHAFPENRAGKIIISLQKNEQGLCRLSVQDDGTGLPEDAENQGGLGFTLVKSMVEQLEGKLEINRKEGSRLTVLFKEEF